MSFLSNMDNAKTILKACDEIDRLESEADHVMRAAMAKLFRDEPDVRQVIKVDRWSRRLQLLSASLYSLGHGGNDAQKTAGIIWMLLIAYGVAGAKDGIPTWHGGWANSSCKRWPAGFDGG